MKLFHTADWHLGKLVQGVYMTEDQRYVLQQFLQAIEEERPDAVIIAGDLYDRAVPPTEAVELLDELLRTIVIDMKTPVLAISGNHDSPDRINFGTKLMEGCGLYLSGTLQEEIKPVVLSDEHGEVHFYLVPYSDPAQVRHLLQDDDIRSHDDAMRALTARMATAMKPDVRRVLVGHAFVTPHGEAEHNTSDSERPLSIGGAEHVSAAHFASFHYTALGHLHQAHYVLNESIQYAGSPLKYSISEETHRKGFLVVELGEDGSVSVARRELRPLRDLRRVAASLEELESHPISEDYVYVTLLNDNPVLFPMEKVRAVYPNALHVERRPASISQEERDALAAEGGSIAQGRRDANPLELFESFYKEIKGAPLSESKKTLFAEELQALIREEGGAV